MFHEVRMNSYSIDAIFGEDSGTFSQPEISGLNQSFLNAWTIKKVGFYRPFLLPSYFIGLGPSLERLPILKK